MDPEKRARRQSLRIVISEAIMVVSVVLLVIILALLVSGYWLNSDFKVERQGMLQISSVPSGANVEVDGDAPWFQRTNTSKVLAAGEHSVSLSKEGYDTWSKTIDIREGLLYRIHYPRLFLLEREATPVYDLTGTTFATVSPDRTKLVATNDTTTWQILDLTNQKLAPKAYSVASVAEGETEEIFGGKILSADWDSGNEHILLQVEFSGHTDWVLLNINRPAESINITKEFLAPDLTEVKIFNNSASQLLALRAGGLVKIDVPARQISAPLAMNVTSFDYYGSEIIYVTSAPTYAINLLQGDALPKQFMALDAPAEVFVSRFYDDKYITTISGSRVTVYREDNSDEVVSFVLTFAPAKSKIGGSGEFVAMVNGTRIATLDMESLELIEWDIDSMNYGWLDDSMIYAINGDTLGVYDFDGLNHRMLSHGVSDKFPVTIGDDKWLYYVSGHNLVREVIAK